MDNFPLLLMRFAVVIGIYLVLFLLSNVIMERHPQRLESYIYRALEMSIYSEIGLLLLFPYFRNDSERPDIRALLTKLPAPSLLLMIGGAVVIYLWVELQDWLNEMASWNSAYLTLDGSMGPSNLFFSFMGILTNVLVYGLPLFLTFLYFKTQRQFSSNNGAAHRKRILASFILFFVASKAFLIVYSFISNLILWKLGTWIDSSLGVLAINMLFVFALYSRYQLFLAAIVSFPYEARHIDSVELAPKKVNDQLLDQNG